MYVYLLNGRRISMSARAKTVNREDISSAISRHMNCEWGKVTEALARMNREAQSNRQPTISGHTDRNGEFFAVRYQPTNGLIRVCMASEVP